MNGVAIAKQEAGGGGGGGELIIFAYLLVFNGWVQSKRKLVGQGEEGSI